jgi:hypothetical protein
MYKLRANQSRNCPRQKKDKQPLQQTTMMQANLKYVRGKPMLTANQLREAGRYCIELHNYYSQNYKTDEDIIVQYKEHHFLLSDNIFVITFSDLYNVFTLDVLDIFLMRYFIL